MTGIDLILSVIYYTVELKTDISSFK